MVTLGIDRIQEYPQLFKGKRLGLITNYSGVNSQLMDDMDAMAAAGYTVVKLFTPEHGLYGAMDGAAVENSRHPVYNIEMISLYGKRNLMSNKSKTERYRTWKSPPQFLFFPDREGGRKTFSSV